MTALLVSVRSAEEALAALAGGAGLIDVKEPTRGSLGRADAVVREEVARVVAGRVPLSAAMGELRDWKGIDTSALSHFSYLKWGLAGCGSDDAWRTRLSTIAAGLDSRGTCCKVVAAAYADWQQAAAPSPDAVLAVAVEIGAGAFLLDTWHKDGRTLLDWLCAAQVADLCQRCRDAGLPVALAGSLGPDEIALLLPFAPDWFAVRGAVTPGRDRERTLDPALVRRLAASLTTLRES